MGKNRVVYAIKVESLSSSGLKMMDVKIGKTTNIDSTLSQYQRSHREVEILDLWKPNKDIGLSKCEKGVQEIAEHHAHERERELFVFLQNSYEKFSEEISRLLKRTSKDELHKEEKRKKSTKNQEKEEFDLVDKSKDFDPTGREPKMVKFKEELFEVTSWKELMKVTTGKVAVEVDDFSKVEEIQGRTRIYFSTNEDEVVNPLKIPNSSYYVMAHASARLITNILSRLLNKFDYQKDEVKITLEN